jgi:hypothetical protein
MIVMAHPHYSPPPTPVQEEIRSALEKSRLESRLKRLEEGLEEDAENIEDELPEISTS